MSNLSVSTVTPDKPILIDEASVVTGVEPRRINRMIDDEILPAYACVKTGKRRALYAYAVPAVSFCASDGAKLNKSLRLEAVEAIVSFTKDNWLHLLKEPAHANTFRFKSGMIVIGLGEDFSKAMSVLSKLLDAKTCVIENPDIRGGIPTIRGTRIGVYEAAGLLSAGGMNEALECYPTLTQDDLEAAAVYARAHPITGQPRARAQNLTGTYPNLQLISEDTEVLQVAS